MTAATGTTTATAIFPPAERPPLLLCDVVDGVARAAASDDVDDVRELVGVAVDVAAGKTGPAAVDVRTTVVATAVAPLLEGDSVITDVISAVVATGATGAAEEAGAAGCADVEAANEEAGAAELENCWAEELGGGEDEDGANDEDDAGGGDDDDDDGAGAAEEKTDEVAGNEDADELVKPRAEATIVHECQLRAHHERKSTYLSSLTC